MVVVLSGCANFDQIWPRYRFEPQADFLRDSSGAVDADNLKLSFKGTTYALTDSTPPDTVPLYLEGMFTIPIEFVNLGRRTFRNVFHPYGDAPVWLSVDASWEGVTDSTPPNSELRIDSMFLEYVDEHRIRPFAWIDKTNYTQGVQKYVKLGPFPLDYLSVRDILDARDVRDIPRYRLSFNAELLDSLGNRLSYNHFETFLSFEMAEVRVTDSTIRHTEGRVDQY